jgi:glycerol-3-phosphate dehydrogenase
MDRKKILSRVMERAQPWDLTVIGGGATGVGCALDAASRGLDVLLLERGDFGSGTSSRSTKLIHGGVRYLRQGNISLVREALRERGVLLRNAPHIVQTQEFIVPCYSLWQKLFYGAGLKVYDLLSGRQSLGRSRVLSRHETLQRLPSIAMEGISGGILYTDGQFDDARLLIDMAVTASRHGATLINYAGVKSLVIDDGKTWTISVSDTRDGIQFAVRSSCVINATGAFVDPIRKMSDPNAEPIVTFARGTHIVLPRRFMASDAALMIPKTSDGRVLFCIPWHEHLLIGTTDVPCETTELGQIPTDDEVNFLLNTAGSFLIERPGRSDILSKFAGVRPLVRRRGSTNTASLSRSHELFVDDKGLITITGGKWTTYRQMAEEAVDMAIANNHLGGRACVTGSLKIDAPSPPVGEQLHPELPYTTGDLERAVREEMAQTVDDILARRTRAVLLNVKAARQMAPIAAEVISRILERNESQISDDLRRFEVETRMFNMP